MPVDLDDAVTNSEWKLSKRFCVGPARTGAERIQETKLWAGHDSSGTDFAAIQGPARVRAEPIEYINAIIGFSDANNPSIDLAYPNAPRAEIGLSY